MMREIKCKKNRETSAPIRFNPFKSFFQETEGGVEKTKVRLGVRQTF